MTDLLDKHLDADVTDGPAAQDDFFKDFDALVPAGEYAFSRPDGPVDVDYEDKTTTDQDIASLLAPGAAPKIDEPEDGFVRLPGGLITDNGLVTTATVRELNGEDEEALAKAQGDLRRLRALLGAVETIGDEPVTKETLKELLIGDREALVLGIRIATFGKEITYNDYLCPGCAEPLDVSIDLSTLEMKELPDREKREFEIPLKKGGVALVRLPNGSDQEAIFELPNATVAEENTLMLSRVVLALNGKKINNAKDPIKKLGVADRQTILKFLSDTQPGPRYDEVKSTHETCGTEFPIFLALDDMFRGV